MAKGYFLRAGDKTTCGEILTGSPTGYWRGEKAALEGSKVTCGKNPGVMYCIVGGTGKIRSNGCPMDGTLDSVSTCPCRATFIPTIPDGYDKEPDSVRSPQSAAPVYLSLSAPT